MAELGQAMLWRLVATTHPRRRFQVAQCDQPNTFIVEDPEIPEAVADGLAALDRKEYGDSLALHVVMQLLG
jgi:hypothetical protein